MDNKKKVQNDLAFVIEDDRDIASTYARVVQEAGYQVEVFDDGKAAYERLQIEPAPGLVFLDLHLPAVTGNEIAWEMWFEMEGTSIVIITADADMANLYRNKEEVEDVFVKPVPLNVLKQVAEQYLNSDEGEPDFEI